MMQGRTIEEERTSEGMAMGNQNGSMPRGFIKWENKQNPLESEVILTVIHLQKKMKKSISTGRSVQIMMTNRNELQKRGDE